MVQNLPLLVLRALNSIDSGIFLLFLFTKEKASVSTIKDYRAILSLMFKFLSPGDFVFT